MCFTHACTYGSCPTHLQVKYYECGIFASWLVCDDLQGLRASVLLCHGMPMQPLLPMLCGPRPGGHLLSWGENRVCLIPALTCGQSHVSSKPSSSPCPPAPLRPPYRRLPSTLTTARCCCSARCCLRAWRSTRRAPTTCARSRGWTPPTAQLPPF